MGEKRIINQEASDEIYNDDWFLKDSVLHDTKKVQPSVIKEYMNQGMATSQDLADEATARQNMDSQLASGIGKQMSNLADFYDTTKSYVIGDVCVLQSGELMRCIAPTSGTFDNTKWEEVTVDDLIDEIDLSAEAISYDNLTTGLMATNVQGAIDEIDGTVDEIGSDVDSIEADLEEKQKQIDANTMVGTASGEIATFLDGSNLPMKSCVAEINPVQDLHGYDNPWPAGGGKNKLDPNIISGDALSGTVTDFYYVTLKTSFKLEANKTYTLSANVTSSVSSFLFSVGVGVEDGGYVNDIATQSNLSSGRVSVTFTPTSEQLETYQYLKIRCPRYGAKQSFTYSISQIQLEEGSSATSYAPYSNICPISGWDEANVSVSGFNVWDEEWINGYYNQGQFISTQDAICCKNKISVKPNTNMYYAKNFSTESNFYYTFYDINGNFLPLSGYDASGRYAKSASGIISVPSSAYYMTFNMGSAYGRTYNNDISINYPSTDTDYHAYNGQTYTIDLDGTRYGGKVDLVSGVMTITHKEIDLGDKSWNKTSVATGIPYGYFSTNISDMPVGATGTLCSNYGESSVWTTDKKYRISSSSSTLFIIDSDYINGTSSQFKDAMSGVTFVYPLIEPQTYQLSPTEVDSLLGLNNVWTDTNGDISVEYTRDATEIINELLARIEALENA